MSDRSYLLLSDSTLMMVPFNYDDKGYFSFGSVFGRVCYLDIRVSHFSQPIIILYTYQGSNYKYKYMKKY
jgi:hypothetical protein